MQATLTEDNFPVVVQTILQNNNELRKQAEDLINQFKVAQPDQFIALLINNLKSSQHAEIRSFCAIAIRKNLSAFSEKSYSNIWSDLQLQVQDFVKVTLIETVQTESTSNIRHLICDAISEIAGSLFNEEVNEQRKGINAWPEILPTIFQLYLSGSPSLIEASLKIMTSLFTYAATDFIKHINEIHNIFKESIINPLDNIKVAAIEALGSFISILEPKECRLFEDLITPLINTTVNLVERNEDGGDTALSVLSDIAEVESKFLKKNFEELFRAMQKITLLKDLSTPENTKQLAVEIIILVGERIPRLLRENQPLLKELLELIFTRMIDIDEDTPKSWMSPPEGFNLDEEDEDESNVKFGMSSVDRLISAVGEKLTLPILSQMVEQMLTQSSDWRIKNAALMALSQVGEYLDSVNDVEPIVNIILQLLGNQHPRIRYAAAHCIAELSDDMEPQFQEHFHQKILPILLNLLDDQIPRVQCNVLAALTSFLDGSEQSYVLSILNPLLEKTFSILQGGISICKENALGCISSISEAAKDAYIPYYHKSLEILYSTLKTYSTKEYKQLRGQCIECITLTSVAAGGNNFKKYAKDIIDLMIQIQQNYNEEIDPNPTYLFSGWHRICMVLQTDFVSYLPTVIPSLFRMSQTIFEQAAKEDELDDDEQDIAQSVKKASGYQTKDEEKKQNINTSYTEDAEIAIHMISVFIDELKGHFINYVEPTAKLIIPMVNFQTNENIRKAAAKALPELIECVKLSNNPNKDFIVGEMARMFIKEVWSALNTEYDPDVIIDQQLAVKEIIDHSGRFLNQNEIEELATKILLSLKNSNDRKAENENFKNEDDVEQEELDVLNDDTNLEDDLHIAIAELCGSLFKTHKELTVPFAKIIYREILTKVLQPTASNMMHKFGIFLVDDMIEYLGIELIPEEWPYLSEALLRYATDPFLSVRQAACFGIGTLAIKSTNTFSDMAESCLKQLIQALNLPKGEESEKEYYHFRDNAVASLGKILQAHPDKIDLINVCEIWLHNLPLKHDKQEALIQHQLLKDIILNKPELVMGTDGKNLPQILRVFGEVINTKYCNEETKLGVKQFVVQISQNDQLKLALQNILGALSEKQRHTLQELYHSN